MHSEVDLLSGTSKHRLITLVYLAVRASQVAQW